MKGKLEIMKISGGGLDNGGNPIPVSEIWSKPLPCLIVPNSRGDLRLYEGGQYVAATYEILISNINKAVFVRDGVESEEEFALSQIKLTDSRSHSMGEKTVLPENVRYLDAVQKIQILV